MSAKKSGSKTATKPAPAQDVPLRPDLFENLGNKANWLALGLVLVVAFFVFRDYLLLNKIYLFRDIGSDSLNASWPWMAHSADYIAQYGTPSWTFNMGMGQNLLSFSVYDPFDYLLYPFGKEKMPYLIAYKEVAKILISGFLFFRYLKLLKLSNYVACVGSLMFAFCGYMIVGSGWYLFSFEVMVAAMLLLSFELLYQKNKWYWFAIPMFLIGISRPFNLWVYAIFLLVYILFRIYQDEEKIEIKKTALLLARILGVSVLALGMSAPFLLEHLDVMINSPRGTGPDSYSHTLSSAPMFRLNGKIEMGTAILRSFSNDIMGTGINFKGPDNFLEAPAFYCGIPCLVLLLQYFQFLTKKVKRVAIGLLVFWLLPVIFPYFRQAFWLFSGDYFRTYSFFVSIVFIFFSVFALEQILATGKLNTKLLFISSGVLLLLLYIPYFPDKGRVDGGIRLFAVLAVVYYTVVLYMSAKQKDKLNYKYALLLFFLVELSYFSWCSANRRTVVVQKDLAQKVGYNDYTLEAVENLKKTDNSFYRIDKNYFSSPAMHGSLNDGMAQGYYGTSCYNPFNQLHYINYLKTMGVINKVNELESRWSPGLGNRFILESLNGVKYVLSKGGYTQPIWHVTHDSIGKFGDVLVLKNKFSLPFGFAYDRYVKLSDFERISLAQRDFVSTLACVINDEDVAKVGGLKEYNLKDTLPSNLFTVDVLKQNIDSLRKNVLSMSEFKPTVLKGVIDISARKVLYTSLPLDKGWSVADKGSAIEPIVLSNGMTGLILEAGHHELEFTFTSRNYEKGKMIALGAFLLWAAAVLLYIWNQRKKKILAAE